MTISFVCLQCALSMQPGTQHFFSSGEEKKTLVDGAGIEVGAAPDMYTHNVTTKTIAGDGGGEEAEEDIIRTATRSRASRTLCQLASTAYILVHGYSSSSPSPTFHSCALAPPREGSTFFLTRIDLLSNACGYLHTNKTQIKHKLKTKFNLKNQQIAKCCEMCHKR